MLGRYNDRSAMICRWITCAAALLLFATDSVATDRFYPDCDEQSPDGRYRVTATSPQNAGGAQPFARNFTYTLTDTTDDRVLWTRKQRGGEGSPIRIFVSNEPWVVVWTGSDMLFVVEPAQGKRILQIGVIEEFPELERWGPYVAHTTAGPMWTSQSRWHFMEHADCDYFVIRAWWDRRVIVDLTNATVVREPDKALLQACDEADRRFVLETLRAFEATLKSDPQMESQHESYYDTMWAVTTAAHLAGRMQIREAIPLLRAVEHYGNVFSSRGLGSNDEYKVGEIYPFNVSTAWLRRHVHLALRKLGEKPAKLPCTWFRYKSNDGPGEYVETPELPAPRAERVDLLKAGMTPIEVLRTIGPPDFVIHGREPAWEYDMDTEEPYTLCVFWRDLKVVEKWQKVTPPRWQDGDRRYVDLLF